ncbi:hypothetical protein F511_39739 [Dorcoceras hygrometricum]|uniref:Dystroglycan-like n=1 Tax=Dorcoceras hygrometricum TaxID=472368 RepID=A0A2Z7BR19_9LAMI|nr:hypothetical protein F511_39739 [Dorcoceras hygrometricum]
MASSLFVNTVHICFDSVLAMDNQGMVAMFESLVPTGLKGFLGCPAVLHEAALLEFFENGSVRYGLEISTVNGLSVEISEQLLAETFEIPIEGLSDLSEISKDLVVDARSIVSLTGEPVSMSGKKKEMKIEFRLLCDIIAKKISVKAGSFDAITQEKFLMIAGITCGVQVKWNKILFNILKDMVTAETRQARGYAIQISLLLENIPNLDLGESTEFPSSKILTEKTVHRHIILNERVGDEDVTDAPRVKRTPVKMAVSKKRSDVVDTEAAPIVKKKRTTQSKPVSSKDTLVTRLVEAVPLQMIAPTTAALTEKLPFPKRPNQKRKRRLILGSDDEIIESDPVVAVSEPAVADVVNEGPSTTDDVDDIIQQVLTETAQIGADKDEIDGDGETVSGSAVGSQAVDKVDEFEQWLNLSYEEFHARQADRPVETASDTEDEMDSDVGNQVLPVVGGTNVVLGKNVDEAMSLEDILMSIPVEVRLPSAGVEVMKITLGKSIKIPGVDEMTWYMASLPQIPVDDKGKKPLLEKDPVKGNPVEEQFWLIVVDIDMLVQLREQIIDEVTKFFYSFSLKRLSNLKIDDSYFAKEELVLSWAEAESTGVALQRRMYILLKYREMLIRKFLEARKLNFAPGDGSSATDLKILYCLSDLHLFVLEELKEQSLVHGLRWDKTCCSKIFEGRNRDRGAVIARSNTNTKSSYWIRTMLRVDGTWGEDSSSRGPQPPPDDKDRPTGEGSANREAGIRGCGGRNRGGSGSSGSQSRGSGSGGDGRRRGDSARSSKRRRSGESPPRNVRYGPYPPTGVLKRSAEYWCTGKKDF